MISTALRIVEDLAQYVVHGQDSAMIVEIEDLKVHDARFDLRFLVTQLLNWLVASPLLRSTLLKNTEQVWYPMLAKLVSRSANLSSVWTATNTSLQLASEVTEQEAELLRKTVLAIYQPHVSSTLR